LQEAFAEGRELRFVINGAYRGHPTNIPFKAKVTSMTQMSSTEWLLALIGEVIPFHGREAITIRAAAYYDVAERGSGRNFILLPLEVRDQL
jgi:hypothetical protein